MEIEEIYYSVDSFIEHWHCSGSVQNLFSSFILNGYWIETRICNGKFAKEFKVHVIPGY